MLILYYLFLHGTIFDLIVIIIPAKKYTQTSPISFLCAVLIKVKKLNLKARFAFCPASHADTPHLIWLSVSL